MRQGLFLAAVGSDDAVSTAASVQVGAMRRRAAKTDGNQGEIVDGLRKAGRSVQSIAAMGDGVPDLLVGNNGETFLLEVKTRTGKLTPDEEMWVANWRGHVAVVRSVEEAIAATGLPFED